MKYRYQTDPIPQNQRKSLNEKVLYLIGSIPAPDCPITPEDIYNAYTGDGGLHGLKRGDYDNYNAYSEAKKEIEHGQFFTPEALRKQSGGRSYLRHGKFLQLHAC